MILDNLNNAKKSIDTTNSMTKTTLTHERSTIVVLMFHIKIVVSIINATNNNRHFPCVEYYHIWHDISGGN
jgi:hypothetical protein